MVKHQCEFCGKEKEYKYPSLVKRYCSHECANQAAWQKREKGEVENITCKICGNVFSVLLSVKRIRERNGAQIQYCSQKCMGIGTRTRETVACKNCGQTFETTRAKEGKGVFCSKKCASEYRKKTGMMKKGGWWLENGYKVLYLDDGTSIKEHIKVMQDFIGRELKSNEEVHHKNEKKLDNEIGNLQLLTKGEHSRLHRNKEKAKGKHLFGGHHNN